MRKLKPFIGKEVFIHIAPRTARESILKHGIVPNMPASQLGETSERDRVYLFMKTELAHVLDWMSKFDGFDIWGVSGLSPNQCKPDKTIKGRKPFDHRQSLLNYGTMAYNGKIAPTNVRLMGSFVKE